MFQLCGLLLYAFVTTASTQERDRLWHTTTPGPSTLSPEEPSPSITGVPAVEDVPVAAEPAGDAEQVVPPEVVAPAESTAEDSLDTRGVQADQDVLTEKTPEKKQEPVPAVEGKKEKKKDRKWISASKEVEEIPVEKILEDQKEEQILKEQMEEKILKEQKEEKKERKWMSASKEEKVDEVPAPEEIKEPEHETIAEIIKEIENVSAEVHSGESTPKNKKKKPRKWISVPGVALEESDAPVVPPTEEDISVAKESLALAQEAIPEKPLLSSESPEKEVDLYSINALDMALPENITELLLAAEEGIPLVQETIISKKTTVYVTISDSIDAEPLFVNLTGIRHYTGQERRMMTGCLDLSDLMLTGESSLNNFNVISLTKVFFPCSLTLKMFYQMS